jgi:hypothetical protein
MGNEAKALVEALYAGLEPQTAQTRRAIREGALATFTEALDARLKGLRRGESLQITFRVDVVGEDGLVREGVTDERLLAPAQRWGRDVLERDGHRCRECGATEGLQAHHVLAWAEHPQSRYDLDNGLTLCRLCHAGKHPEHRNLIQRAPGRRRPS